MVVVTEKITSLRKSKVTTNIVVRNFGLSYQGMTNCIWKS